MPVTDFPTELVCGILQQRASMNLPLEGIDVAELIGVTHYVPECDRESTKAETAATPREGLQVSCRLCEREGSIMKKVVCILGIITILFLCLAGFLIATGHAATTSSKKSNAFGAQTITVDPNVTLVASLPRWRGPQG